MGRKREDAIDVCITLLYRRIGRLECHLMDLIEFMQTRILLSPSERTVLGEIHETLDKEPRLDEGEE